MFLLLKTWGGVYWKYCHCTTEDNNGEMMIYEIKNNKDLSEPNRLCGSSDRL